MEKIVLKGRGAFKGKAEGYALVCPNSITGWNGINTITGVIKDYQSPNRGRSIKNTILVLPSSKGSNGWSCYFSASRMSGANPAGWIFNEIDSSSAVAAAGVRIPTVVGFTDENDPCKIIENGDYIYLNGDTGEVEIIKNNLMKTYVTEVDNVLHIGGQLPDQAENLAELSFKDQARAVFSALAQKAHTNGGSIENTLMNYIHITDMSLLGEMNEVYPEFYKGEGMPARITVETTALPAGAKIAVTSLIAKNDTGRKTWETKNKTFASSISPTATIHNGLIRLNGHISTNPETGELVRDSFKSQARTILNNIKTLLEEAGTSMDNVVHVNTKISCDKYFREYIDVYHEFFGEMDKHPARVASTAYIWDGLDLELSVTAAMNAEDKKVYRSEKYKALSTKSYPTANLYKNTVFCSGIISNDMQTGELICADVITETKVCFDNLKAVMDDLGQSLASVTTLDIYITEIDKYDLVKEMVEKEFGGNPPAVSIIETKEVFGGLKVEFGTLAKIK